MILFFICVENADALRSFTAKKKENALGMKGVTSAKTDTADDSVTFKRKLCDRSNFIDKPVKVDGFREVKSSKKMVSVLGKFNDLWLLIHFHSFIASVT